ncbi:TolC family protein [Acinetobacter sp. MB5]|uniref:TolC family protein n=1 Tax=Acinetobacter sp. MB5 TaxID=2069438 RepID=UPI000DD0A499|nr:TolC family protein [Acinetobacter sp. MB5]
MRKLIYSVLVVLTGCTTYHAQPLAPAQLVQQFEERSLDSPDLHAYIQHALGHDIAWPVAHWNREMLTLAAFYYNPSLDVSRAEWESSKAEIDVAKARPNPVLQLPFQAATSGSGISRFSLGFALDIPIETAHKRGYRINQASHVSEAARLNIRDQAWKVSADVRDALLELYAARERMGLLSHQTSAQQQIVNMSRKRLALGQFSQPEFNEAVLVNTQTQSQLLEARSSEQTALNSLAKAIGLPVSALKGIHFDLSEFQQIPVIPPKSVQRQAILQRADLLSSLADYAASESVLQLEVAKQYPDIHLGPGYTYDMGTNKIAFGLAGVSLPIFDRNQGGIRVAEAKRKEAAARTEALQDKILGDLSQALLGYQSSQAAMRLAIQSRTTAQQQLKHQATAFKVGNLDRLSYTQALIAYQTSQLNTLDATISAQKAAGDLEDVLQRFLNHDLTSNNKLVQMQELNP